MSLNPKSVFGLRDGGCRKEDAGGEWVQNKLHAPAVSCPDTKWIPLLTASSLPQLSGKITSELIN